MTTHHDLLILGGGTAGLVTAAGAAYLGARPVLIERDRLGGDCLWTGCVPSKALLASARAAAVRRDGSAFGLAGSAPAPSFGAVMAAMHAARRAIEPHDDPARFRALGVDVRVGAAEFAGPGEVVVRGERLRSRRIVVATGSRPAVPPIPGLEEAGYLTHATLFDLTVAPHAIAILGGGPIGVECAQFLARLGVSVTLLEAAPRILPGEDPEAAAVVSAALSADGVRVVAGVTIRRIGLDATQRVLAGHTGDGGAIEVRADTILVATGRVANVESLRLDRVGLLADPAGLAVDPYLATAAPGIWAAGDVTGSPCFTHWADHQARLVVRNALTPFPARLDRRLIPRVLYTDPELAQLGPSESEACAAEPGARVWRYDFADLDRAITDRATAGFVKLLTTRRGRVLGATIVGAGAGELLAPVGLAIRQRLSVHALAEGIHPYPTLAEGVKRAAEQARRAELHGVGGRVLRWLVRRGL